ncbi:MAG TPA: acyclic terpene utilization AtuA family protein, partial [Candidatus Nanoarchaeia archaeon]|nr:acyclic terpene utilization AtuA family protein [Candidatus Nanoarchaeia archaeon]
MKSIRTANGGGFMGDYSEALYNQVTGGHIDYLTADSLAELTTLIVRGQMARDSRLGYAKDFLRNITPALKEIKQKGIKVVTNFGALNPEGAAYALRDAAANLGLDFKIAYITGDNVYSRLEELSAKSNILHNIETGTGIDLEKVLVANAYIGSDGIKAALDRGADIVIVGRATDTSLVLGPLMHEFNWKNNYWNLKAAGIIAGDILECGAQATGGNFSRPEEILADSSYKNIGYPIAVFNPDGTFWITKHDGTGGAVTVNTVTNQLLYELGDPARYISPDAIANFLTINLKQDGKDRVFVSGIRGQPYTDTYKVSMGLRTDKYKATGSVMLCGGDVLGAAELFQQILWDRVKGNPSEVKVERVGYDSCNRGGAPPSYKPDEILLRIGVSDSDKRIVDKFSREFVSVTLSGSEGVTYVVEGVPRTGKETTVAYCPSLVPKECIDQKITILDGKSSETFTIRGSDFRPHSKTEVYRPNFDLSNVVPRNSSR